MPPLDPKKTVPSSHQGLDGAYGQEGGYIAGPEAPPPALSSAPSIGALMHSLRRAWTTVLPLALVLALVAGAVAWFAVPAQYTSTTSFELRTGTLGPLDGDENLANLQKAQASFLKSYEVLSDAINKARLAEQFGIVYTPQSLARKLTIHFNDGPAEMGVMLSGENPEALKAMLDALGTVYPDRVLANDKARVNQSIEQRKKQFDKLADQLHDARVQLNKAREKAGIFNEKGLIKNWEDAARLREATMKDLRAAETALADLESQKAAKKRRIDDPLEVTVSDIEAEQSLAGNTTYADLMRDIEAKNKAVASIRAVAKPDQLDKLLSGPLADLAGLNRERSRQLTAAKRKVAERQQALAIEKDRADLADLADRTERAAERRKALEVELTKWSREVERFKKEGPNAPPEVLRLEDAVTHLETEQKGIGTQLGSLKAIMPDEGRRRVLCRSEAFLPTEKEYSRPLKYALGAFALVFVLSLVGGCLFEARHRKVSASDDVRQGLGLRVIGTIPALPVAARSKSASALSLGGLDSQFGLTEAVDSVRTTLLHAPHADGTRVVMITSAITGEGKTTLASHLAASLARAWRKTLIIDADLRNPNVHGQFDLPPGPGLCEALRGEIEFEEAIKPTMLGRLWMMPAGQVDGHALQALTQDGLHAVFERLKDQFDFIVIDTSPVIPVPDALMLGKHADAAILSVMKDVSSMPAVYEAQRKLDDLGIRVLGAVVIGERTETYGRAVPYGTGKKT